MKLAWWLRLNIFPLHTDLLVTVVGCCSYRTNLLHIQSTTGWWFKICLFFRISATINHWFVNLNANILLLSKQKIVTEQKHLKGVFFSWSHIDSRKMADKCILVCHTARDVIYCTILLFTCIYEVFRFLMMVNALVFLRQRGVVLL